MKKVYSSDIVNGKDCGPVGYWISGSKGTVKISDMGYFHLGAAIKKIEKATIKTYSGIEKKIPVELRDVVVQKLVCNIKYIELIKEFKKLNSFNRRK